MKKKIKYIITFVAGFVITNNVLAASFYNENEGTMNICGLDNMSPRIPAFTSGLYNVIKILVPVILVIMGMIDFTKAVMASDEEKMKKSQKTFITRAIAAVIIFFVMTVVQFIFKEVDKNNANGFADCMNCILSNKSCGQVKKEEKKTCEQYTGNCPETDEYGHSCSKDYNSGNKCKTKGTACSDFRKKECNGAKTTSGVSCEYVGISCRSVCSGLSIGSCYNESHCEWTGGDPNNGYCQNKTVKNSDQQTTSTSSTDSNTTSTQNNESVGSCQQQCTSQGKTGQDHARCVESCSKNNSQTTISTQTRIFVGDSRTVGMCIAAGAGDYASCSSAPYVSGNNIFIAKEAKGLSWFKAMQSTIDSKITSKTSIIIMMGVNDVGNSEKSGLTAANKYINYLNDTISSWLDKGVKVYFVSVNPVGNAKYVTNAAIESFNSKIKNYSKIRYIDTNNKISYPSNIYDNEGLHYSNSKYKEIYNYIMSRT